MKNIDVTMVNQVSGDIVDAAVQIHRALGPGLLESIYERCLAHELRLRGLDVRAQVPLAITYKDLLIRHAYRLDLLVEGCIVCEVKAVEETKPLFKAQVLTYLKAGNFPLGFLLNFNVEVMRQGIKRIAYRMKPAPILSS